MTDTVFRLVLATLGFAVFTDVADDTSEFRDMRRIGGCHLTQCGARRGQVLNGLCASSQLLLAIAQQRQAMRDADISRIDAVRRGGNEVTIFHRRVIVMFVSGRWRIRRPGNCRARQTRHGNDLEKLPSIHGH